MSKSEESKHMAQRRYSTGDLVPFSELELRWRGLSKGELISMVNRKEIMALVRIKELKSDTGEHWTYCESLNNMNDCGADAVSALDFKNIVFKTKDVEDVEFVNPEYLWERIDKSFCSKMIDPCSAYGDECMSHCSREHTEGDTCKDVVLINQRTINATKGKVNKCVDEWKSHAAQMVRVAVACGEEGAKGRRKKDITKLANKLLGPNDAEKLFGKPPHTTVAFDIFWKSLPEEHKSTKPGANKQE